jgi:hypothetical protein
MRVLARSHRIGIASLTVAMLLGPAPMASVGAIEDVTPPTGTASPREFRPTDETIELRFAFSDPESGVVSIDLACDFGPVATYPYATTLFIPAHDLDAGGCPGFGMRWMRGEVVNGAGLTTHFEFPVDVDPVVRFEYPLEPRTGHPFTIHPVYSEGYTFPGSTICRWEFRWGSTAALRDGDFDETFGSMLFEGKASDGFCGDWTFTLPWVPVPQFELSFDGPAIDVRSGSWPDRELIHATVDGTDRRIRESNLPVAQVLPSTYTPIVGQPITYTRYLIGGASGGGQAVWVAHLGKGEHPIVWEKQTNASTFTITPPTTGDLLVQWYRQIGSNLLLALYDPPVRYRDRTDPTTSTPKVRFGSGDGGESLPLEISWTAKDAGWGVKAYRLERSLNGGAWTKVATASEKTRGAIQAVPVGSTVRYRVRATDKAGNIGSWKTTSTIGVRRTSDTSPTSALAYSGSWAPIPDATALGGVLHEASSAGAAVSFTFRGRALAWVAERGPDHGLAKVYLDGKLAATLDLTNPSAAPHRIVFRRDWATVGDHRIRVVVSGTVGRPIVDLDAFVFLR